VHARHAEIVGQLALVVRERREGAQVRPVAAALAVAAHAVRIQHALHLALKIKIEGLRGDDAVNALLDRKSDAPGQTGAFKIQGGASGNVTPLRKR
jgi:hypothetical protein